MSAPKSLILNSPFEPPRFHWQDERDQLKLVHGRRDAGYEIFDTRNNTRRTEPLERVNRIRERVNAWREAGYPGITSVTRSLLEHWNDATARQYPFYFCQIEAVETLIWWVEATQEHRQGIFVPGDGGAWERLCNKMATGAGKTTVMAMIVAWQVLNAQTYPKRNKDFSRAVFIVAPGLTVKERLQVLLPGNPANTYDEFRLCPSETLRQRLNQAEVLIENWHSLMPLKQVERSVVRKGAESDKAFVRRVLGKLAGCKDLIVINDEAHHAYRIPADVKISRKMAEEQGIDLDEATRWIEGLDRIHGQLRIARCFDLSATPFAPTGRTNTEQGLFDCGLGLRAERCHRSRAGEDAQGGGARRRVAGYADLAPEALSPLPRSGCVGRPEPQKCAATRIAAAAGTAGLHLAGRGLAQDAGRMEGRGACVAAGLADGVQSHGDRGAHRALLQQRRCALAGVEESGQDLAGGFARAGEGGAGRVVRHGQGLRGAPARDRRERWHSGLGWSR